MPPLNSFLNDILGDDNVFFQGSNGNTIHIGDIVYDKSTNKRTVNCTNINCQAQASEETKEVTRNYVAFTCIVCGNRFYEYDDIVSNSSSYANLNPQEGEELKRLIEAVNHDLQVGEVNYAYKRCLERKEKYGLTPQIYEWGALTLFLTQDIDYWVRQSLDTVKIYLDKSRQLDKKSPTYKRIASSIATRYYQGLVSHMEKAKSHLPAKPQINKKEVPANEQYAIMQNYYETHKSIKKLVFNYLKQIEVCYDISENTGFIEAALKELYGYNGMAWYDRKFAKFMNRPADDKSGQIKLMKGYVWDFHQLISNSNELFENEHTNPSNFLVRLEAKLVEKVHDFNFPEIRVGKLDDEPLSARASLNLFQFGIYIVFLVFGIALWYFFKSKFTIIIYALLIGYYIYQSYNSDKPDSLRRLKNSQTNRF